MLEHPKKIMMQFCKRALLGFSKTSHTSHCCSVCTFLSILLTMGIAGCAQNTSSDSKTTKEISFTLPNPQRYSNILETSYVAADSLGKGLRFRGITPDMPILAASFVDIDDLTQSSTLGRIVSEQIASRLAQHGFKVIETKLRQGSIFIKKGKGEFLLSRELLDLSANQGAQAVLVGTYAVSEYFIFISARVVRTENSAVITGYDYELPQDKTTKSML